MEKIKTVDFSSYFNELSNAIKEEVNARSSGESSYLDCLQDNAGSWQERNDTNVGFRGKYFGNN